MATPREREETHENMVKAYDAIHALGDRPRSSAAITAVCRALDYEVTGTHRRNGVRYLNALHRRGAIAFDGIVRCNVPREKCEFIRPLERPGLWMKP